MFYGILYQRKMVFVVCGFIYLPHPQHDLPYRMSEMVEKIKIPCLIKCKARETFAYEYEMSSQTKNKTLAFIFTDKTT